MEAGVHSVLKGSRTLSPKHQTLTGEWSGCDNSHVIAWHSLDIHSAECRGASCSAQTRRGGGFLFGPKGWERCSCLARTRITEPLPYWPGPDFLTPQTTKNKAA